MQRTRFVGHRLHCELAAYHEAAHAVVALHYGRVVKEVYISHHLLGNGWVKRVRTWFPDVPDTQNPRDALIYWIHVFFRSRARGEDFARRPHRGGEASAHAATIPRRPVRR